MNPLRRRVSLDFDPDEDMTKQSFKDECNINKIMEKFKRTGLVHHYASQAPEYMDVPTIDYQDALNVVASGQSMFDELPAVVRARFQNNPATFIQFATNPANLDEMRTMGLAPPPDPSLDKQAEPKRTQSKSASAPSESSKSDKLKDVNQDP